MKNYNKVLVSPLFILFGLLVGSAACAEEPNYSEVIKQIGIEISALGKEFPQLKDFSPDKHVQLKDLKICYDYKTHKATHAGGWTAGVPNPDDDGIWFYIDFHDPQSTAQIHTQPVT